jgi:hypothetical protein
MVTFLIHKSEIGTAAIPDQPSMKINFKSEISTAPHVPRYEEQNTQSRRNQGPRRRRIEKSADLWQKLTICGKGKRFLAKVNGREHF